jgi:hypothetical protein
MITAVDTNILLDVLIPNAPHTREGNGSLPLPKHCSQITLLILN